ncbi:MAG: hypothetical protein AAF790_14835 [Planctomycetota bacterium]
MLPVVVVANIRTMACHRRLRRAGRIAVWPDVEADVVMGRVTLVAEGMPVGIGAAWLFDLPPAALGVPERFPKAADALSDAWWRQHAGSDWYAGAYAARDLDWIQGRMAEELGSAKLVLPTPRFERLSDELKEATLFVAGAEATHFFDTIRNPL